MLSKLGGAGKTSNDMVTLAPSPNNPFPAPKIASEVKTELQKTGKLGILVRTMLFPYAGSPFRPEPQSLITRDFIT